MTDTPANPSPFSIKTVAILLSVSIFMFLAVVILMGWSPDLRNKDSAGDHPYSSSAIGYGGLVELLEATGRPVRVSRLDTTLTARNDDFLIVTLKAPSYAYFFTNEGPPDDIEDVDIQGPALIVLPKWSGARDRDKPKWQRDTKLLSERTPQNLLDPFDREAKIERVKSPPRIDTPFGMMRPDFEESLQIMAGSNLEPVITVKGGMLVGRVPDGRNDIYVLSDPDLLNTFGLSNIDNARMGIGLLDYLSGGPDVPIVLDATLHGFSRSENLIKTMFDVPFIGATLAALAALGLLGWAATTRFGSPEREARVFALGKEALVDNTAGLVTMCHREPHMAPGYLALMKRLAARDVSAPKTLSEDELSALLGRIGKSAGTSADWADIERSLSQPLGRRDELMSRTRRIWRWRKEISDANK